MRRAAAALPNVTAADSLDMIGNVYASVEGYVAEADLGLGCGVPTEHAGIKPGDTVLDLGVGAGVDAFVARRLVGDEGQVYGVDMTPDMVVRARSNAEKLGCRNVQFGLGEIEHLPFERGSINVVISNCVLNLVPKLSPCLRRGLPRAAARRALLRVGRRGLSPPAGRPPQGRGALCPLCRGG
jgi:SAM-dependent methyltransferase